MVKRNTKNWFRHGNWWKKLRNNRKYRDVLFRYLFQEKKDLLELYNALNGSTYQNPEELEVVTMEDVIFMKMKNDLSFMIGNTLNLYEHQSTWNPNMPLRGLLYFAQQFEGLLASRSDDLYGTGRIALPTPVYIVFYNGSGMRREEAIHTAIDTCIEKGILKDILIRQKAEVLPLLNSLYHPAIRNLKTDTGDSVPYLTQSPEVSRSSTPHPAPSL